MATESQVSDISQTGDEGDSGVDLSAVYTHAHSSGEVRSGNVLDFKAMCAAAGSLTLQEAQVLLKFSSNNGETGEAAEESEAEEAEEAPAEADAAGTEQTADNNAVQQSAVKQSREKAGVADNGHITDRAETEGSAGGREFTAKPPIDAQTAPETGQSSGDRTAEVKPPSNPEKPKIDAERIDSRAETKIADEPAAEIERADNPEESKRLAPEIFTPEASLENQNAETQDAIIQPLPITEAAIELAADDSIDIDNSPQPIEMIEADSQAFEEEDALIFQADIVEEEPPENEEVLFILPEADPDTASLSPELSVPVQEVEETVELIAARLEVAEPEEVQAILDEIILLTAETDELSPAEEVDAEESLAEDETQQRLAELFTELFDQLEIGYTPELVAAFVQLTLKKKPGGAENDNKNSLSLAHDEGTHEVIKQLLAGLGSLKKAIAHAYLVGKSAVRFYIDGLVPAA